MKRLFYDIETSLGIYSNFGQGWNKTLSMKDEIVEPRIICICWKWENESKVYSLEWNEGNDKQLLREFIKILDEAHEIIAHNGDGFDLPWIRGRAIKHRLEIQHDYPITDTLKLARKRAGKGFKFQSNRLDYIAQYLGVGKKISTNLELWQRITYPSFIPLLYPLRKDYYKALKEMVRYCKMDVEVLENVFKVLSPYTPHKYHLGVVMGGNRWDCPNCGSGNIKRKGYSVSTVGIKKQRWQCKDCRKKYSTALKVANDRNQFLLDLKLANERT